jgi:hypothetical protein
MASVKMSAAAALTIATFLSSGCAPFSVRHTARRRTIATYSLWGGMGPPSTDPQFPKFECAGTLTISNVDVTFADGKSPGCASPKHQRTVGTLPYSELREIRVTRRPELLIFSKDAEPPALRVADWVGAADFQRAVTDLQNAYQSWRARTNHSTRK